MHNQKNHLNKSATLGFFLIGFYVLNIQFADKAIEHGYTELTDNFGRAVEKISELCLRYSLRGLIAEDHQQAERYFHLAHAIKLDQSENEFAQELKEIFEDPDYPDNKSKIELISKKQGRISRMVSYEPPEPFEEIPI